MYMFNSWHCVSLVEERMLSMRHKSRGAAMDASQSLYTKEILSHLFGIKKARGQEYKVTPSYATDVLTVVRESTAVTQADGVVVDSKNQLVDSTSMMDLTAMDSGITPDIIDLT